MTRVSAKSALSFDEVVAAPNGQYIILSTLTRRGIAALGRLVDASTVDLTMRRGGAVARRVEDGVGVACAIGLPPGRVRGGELAGLHGDPLVVAVENPLTSDPDVFRQLQHLRTARRSQWFTYTEDIPMSTQNEPDVVELSFPASWRARPLRLETTEPTTTEDDDQ